MSAIEASDSPRLAVIGHIEWVEFVPLSRLPQPGDIIHAREAFARAAGGGGVVAAVLAELGAEVDFYTALGDDVSGRAAVEQLERRGVRTHVAWRSEPTRRAVTMLEEGGERTIVTIGKRLGPLGEDDLNWSRLHDVEGVFVTAGDRAALRRASAVPVIVASPRARSALEGEGPPVSALVFSLRDRDERDWAESLTERTRLLVATEGVRGGRWWGESEGHWQAVAAPGPARDSYGCGDSFAAGFTFGLAAGRSAAEAAMLGAECGARCLTRVGAP